MDWIIEINNLKKSFGDHIAVNDVSLKIPSGKIFGLLGPNGAGKSTTIRMLCGVISPSSGSGTVLGFDLTQSDLIKQNIGYMSQKFSLYTDLTVIENLRFYADIYSLKSDDKKNRISELLELTGLEDRQNFLAEHLSGGWKQRLALSCALLHNPKLLILDEPTAGVDPVSRRIFWETIRQLAKDGISILITTHYMDEAESCDEVAFIFDGKLLVKSTPAELIKEHNCTSLEDVFINYVEMQSGIVVSKSFLKSND